LTFVLSLSSLLFIWGVAIPVGVYAAVRQYSPGDYTFTFLAFLGVAVPDFLIALVLMYIAFKYFGQTVGVLFSPNYITAAWSLSKVIDLLSHLWIPMLVLGLAGTASLIRTLRAKSTRRTAPPLCDYCTRQRAARSMAHYQISGTSRTQSFC
jgi:peptide/nickel transport system permease protein